MSLAVDLWSIKRTFRNLFPYMTVYTKLYWQFKTIFRTVIRVAEKTVKLTFESNFLVLTLYHQGFHALTASDFTTALQIDGFLVLVIK